MSFNRRRASHGPSAIADFLVVLPGVSLENYTSLTKTESTTGISLLFVAAVQLDLCCLFSLEVFLFC